MDHAIRHGRGSTQAFEVGNIAAMGLCARGYKSLGALFGTREAHDLMAGTNELPNDRRTDESSSTCHKYPHCSFLLILKSSLQPSLRFSSRAPRRSRDRAHMRA